MWRVQCAKEASFCFSVTSLTFSQNLLPRDANQRAHFIDLPSNNNNTSQHFLLPKLLLTTTMRSTNYLSFLLVSVVAFSVSSGSAFTPSQPLTCAWGVTSAATKRGRRRTTAVYMDDGGTYADASAYTVVLPTKKESPVAASEEAIVEKIQGPLDFTWENVDLVLEEMRPYLIQDGGNVIITEIVGSVVKLELQVRERSSFGVNWPRTTTNPNPTENVLGEELFSHNTSLLFYAACSFTHFYTILTGWMWNMSVIYTNHENGIGAGTHGYHSRNHWGHSG